MRFRLTLLCLVAVFLLGLESVEAQAGAAAYARRSTISVGAGVSSFAMDWGQRREGVTVWGDFRVLPPVLHRLSPEIEFRDILWSFGQFDETLEERTAYNAAVCTDHEYSLLVRGPNRAARIVQVTHKALTRLISQ